MFNAIDRLYASEQALEVLNHALAEIEDIYSDDPALKNLHCDLEALLSEYERHYQVLDEEARYYENEQAGLLDIMEAM